MMSGQKPESRLCYFCGCAAVPVFRPNSTVIQWVSYCSTTCQAEDWVNDCVPKNRKTEAVEKGRAWHLKGIECLARKNKADACCWFKKSLRIADEEGDRMSAGVLHWALGKIYWEEKLYIKASIHLRLCLKCAHNCIDLPKSTLDRLKKLLKLCEDALPKQNVLAKPHQTQSVSSKRKKTEIPKFKIPHPKINKKSKVV